MSEVTPRLPVHDVVQRVDRDAVLICQQVSRLAACPPVTDCQHRCLVKTGSRVIGPALPRATVLPVCHSSRMTPLRDHVRVVVQERPQEQMVGADASAIVAPMAHVHPARDLAKVHPPRNAVHAVADVLPVGTGNLNMTVASPLPDPRRVPAAIRLHDASPEPGFEINAGKSPVAIALLTHAVIIP